MKYFKNNISLICVLSLIFVCFFVFVINLSEYPFIDTDETKFVSIAKNMLNNSDWINIRYLDNNFFNLSPLYFWLVNLSCVIFAKISTETVRLPISLITCAGVLSLYVFIKPILKNFYAIIISLIYLSSFGIIVFSRLATNDILFSVLAMVSVLFGYLSILTRKYTFLFFIGIYIFSALSVLTGGMFGFIPLIAILLMYIFSGKTKDFFRPLNFVPGIIIFFTLALPWYLIMFHKHNYLFISEFFENYNILSYTGFKQALKVISLFILGFFPWIFSFLVILLSRFKYNLKNKLTYKLNKHRKINKFILLNTVVFFTDLAFALLYGEKYTFLILFLIFPSCCITGHYWYEYIVKDKHNKSIFIAAIIPNLIMIICSLIALFGHNILNTWLYKGLSSLFIPLVIIFFAIPVINICSVIAKWKIAAFITNVILMISLSFVITPRIFNYIVINGGEKDLITFAQETSQNNIPLAAFISSKKYSLEYYYDKPVKFLNSENINEIIEFLEENPDTYVVVEIKDMLNIEENINNYTILSTGKRYCIIKYMPKMEKISEEEIIKEEND